MEIIYSTTANFKYDSIHCSNYRPGSADLVLVISYPILGVPNNPTPYSAQIPESQQQKGFTTFHPYIYHKHSINPTEISWHIWVMFTNLANINQISVPDMHEIWLSMDDIWWNRMFLTDLTDPQDTLIFDFSSKGGPANVEGKWDGTGIVFPDGSSVELGGLVMSELSGAGWWFQTSQWLIVVNSG